MARQPKIPTTGTETLSALPILFSWLNGLANQKSRQPGLKQNGGRRLANQKSRQPGLLLPLPRQPKIPTTGTETRQCLGHARPAHARQPKIPTTGTETWISALGAGSPTKNPDNRD